MPDEIDTTNYWMVGGAGERLVIRIVPRGLITRKEALNLAAWLVAIADENNEFGALLKAVQNT